MPLALSYVRQAMYSRTIEDHYSLHQLTRVTLETTTPDGPCRVWQEREYRLDVCRATNSTPFSTEVIYESFCCIWCLLIFLPYVVTKQQANENPRWLYGHASLMCICTRVPKLGKGCFPESCSHILFGIWYTINTVLAINIQFPWKP
jgi:hypothetical protein